MKLLKKKHIIKIFKYIFDTSALKLAREYHLEDDVKLNPISLFFDTLWCKFRYFILPEDYFYFGFHNKSSRARKTFVGERYRSWIIGQHINCKDNTLLNDKFKTYQFYRPFYRREIIHIDLPEEMSLAMDFANKHGAIVLKPINLNQGQGLCFWSKEEDTSLEGLVKILNENFGGVILEQQIQQDEVMASFHPTSVNTIRYVVDYQKDRIDRLFAIIRMGIGNNKVDNTHAGGICAAVHLESGIIVSKALSQDGKRYLFHPDTGKQILGTQIPRWEELNQMILQLHPAPNPIRLIGWDFALSKNGWVIVEGNSGPSFRSIQGCLGKGYRHVLDSIKRES